MTDLIEKLNVLVRASLRNALSGTGRRKRRDTPLALEDANRGLVALRQQIAHALDEEDQMVANIQALSSQITAWDQEADEALARGDDAAARHTVRQIQAQQQRLALLEADLAEHRLSTGELIRQVNELETLVGEVHRQAQQAAQEAEAARFPSQPDRSDQVRHPTYTGVVGLGPELSPSTDPDDTSIEDDLARRRARLSQPD